MAEQHLDDADVDVLLEQVGGEAGPQSGLVQWPIATYCAAARNR
jgi:hypothetical protein